MRPPRAPLQDRGRGKEALQHNPTGRFESIHVPTSILRSVFRDSFGFSDRVRTALGRSFGFSERVPFTGNVLVEVFDEFGNLKEKRETHNLVVTAGKNHIADQLSASPGGAAMGWMAIGTGTVDPAVGDTALGTEIDRNALTSRTDATNVVTYVGDWAAGDGTNAAITEAGIFNASSGGTMLARVEFTAINKGASDTLKITWTITCG
jgi:hypothetical protein